MIPVSAWKCEWCGRITRDPYDPRHGSYCDRSPGRRSCASCSRVAEIIGSSDSKCSGIGYCKYINELVVYPKTHCMEHQLQEGYEKYTE